MTLEDPDEIAHLVDRDQGVGRIRRQADQPAQHGTVEILGGQQVPRHLGHRLDGRQERRLRGRAMALLDELGLRAFADRPCAGLPYGTLKRIEIARAVIADPRLLLLDEPAAGLTHSEVDELGALVQRLRDQRDLSVLLVEHHMGMVMEISEKVVVMEFGRKIAE
ncbi:MAG: ATP-binding cassette domain-containing protein, partial [Planctomycetota bacterium]